MPGPVHDPADAALRRAASSVVELTRGVFDELHRLKRVVAALDLPARPLPGAAREALEPVVSDLLRREPLLTGAGLAVAPPAGRPRPSAPLFAWWVIRDGEVRAKQHVLNPRSDSFYEVTEARWFRVPCRTGRPALLSPYVDSWGTDDVTMTAVVPLAPAGDSAGVVAADLDVRRYLAALEEILAAAHAAAALDEDDRVIAATRADLEVGARLAATGLRPPAARVGIPEFGWALVRW
jgi:hypothetical protein